MISVPPLIPNKPPFVLNKGHTERIANSFSGFISADSSSSSSNRLANVSSPASGLNLSGKCYTFISYDFQSSTRIVVGSHLKTEKFSITCSMCII